MSIQTELQQHLNNINDNSLTVAERQQTIADYGSFLLDQGDDFGKKVLGLSQSPGFIVDSMDKE